MDSYTTYQSQIDRGDGNWYIVKACLLTSKLSLKTLGPCDIDGY